jgi:hypothetical protein
MISFTCACVDVCVWKHVYFDQRSDLELREMHSFQELKKSQLQLGPSLPCHITALPVCRIFAYELIEQSSILGRGR